MESLSEYVSRVMEEKNLRPIDVARKSGGGIGDSHVTNIASGTTQNVSIERLKALATGLGVDPVELFKVATGAELTEVNLELLSRVFDKLSNSEASKLLILIDRMNQKQLKVLLSAAEKAVKK
jgi:transcriptional regulator with XRE-family HTH domain